VSEFLGRIPGVIARDRQNQAQDLQLSIRGCGARATFGVRGVRIYSDGIPATMPDGQGQVSQLVLDAVDHVEVLRGPFSALYGNSSGGVIQTFSAAPPPVAELTVGPLALAGRGSRGALGWHGPWPGGAARPAGGFAVDLLDAADRGFRDHSAARHAGGQALFRYGGNTSHLVVLAHALDVQADDPQGLTGAEVAARREAASPAALAFDTRKTTRQRQAGARFEHVTRGGSTLSVGSWLGTRDVLQFLSVPVAAQSNPLHGGGVVDLARDYFGADARWRALFAPSGRRLAVTAGAEIGGSNEHRRGFENFRGGTLGVEGALRRDERDDVGSLDEFAQVEWDPAARWRAYAGARASRVRFRSRDAYVTARNPDDSGGRVDRNLSPVGGLLWRVREDVSVYANAGRSFETPTFTELAYRRDGAAGLATDLRAAVSRNVEAGVRARCAAWSADLTFFHSRTTDELAVATNQGGRTTYLNAAPSRRRGIELAATCAGPRGWHWAGAWTLLDARYVGGFGAVRAGSRIAGVPGNAAWGEARWGSGGGFEVAMQATAMGRVWANDANTAAAPPSERFDIGIEDARRVGTRILTAYVRTDNVLDRGLIGSVIVNEANGRYFEPAPGRRWSAGMRTTFGGK